MSNNINPEKTKQKFFEVLDKMAGIPMYIIAACVFTFLLITCIVWGPFWFYFRRRKFIKDQNEIEAEIG